MLCLYGLSFCLPSKAAKIVRKFFWLATFFVFIYAGAYIYTATNFIISDQTIFLKGNLIHLTFRVSNPSIFAVTLVNFQLKDVSGEIFETQIASFPILLNPGDSKIARTAFLFKDYAEGIITLKILGLTNALNFKLK